MKYLMLSAQFAMIMFSAQVLAQDGQDCVALSAGLNPQDRTNFLKGCLGKKSSPSFVEEATAQRKLRYCEQNAKNKSLQGKESADYVSACMTENEAMKERAKMAGKSAS